MARLTADMFSSFANGDSFQCLFCDKVARLKDGRLTRSDFVYWHQRDLLVLCDECVATYLPRLIADIAGSNPDYTWKDAEAVYWRAIANSRGAKTPKRAQPD